MPKPKNMPANIQSPAVLEIPFEETAAMRSESTNDSDPDKK